MGLGFVSRLSKKFRIRNRLKIKAMREIKFKIWNNRTNDMSIDSFTILDLMNRSKTFDVDDVIFLQFTGLKDKNRVDIFEGDIVKSSWSTVFLVYFDEHSCQFQAKLKNGLEREMDYFGINSFEVIGNIHQNPELFQ
jgi:uncharacterized phage protein (TIGR01671 family)